MFGCIFIYNQTWMNCTNCAKTVDNDSNYCKHCGYNFDPLAANPHSTIFENSYQAPARSKTDLGFLIILIIITFNILLWALWSFIGSSLPSGYRTNVIALQIISAASLVAQFIVMFIFVKKQNYRTIIVVVGGLIMFYQIYSIIRTMTFLR